MNGKLKWTFFRKNFFEKILYCILKINLWLIIYIIYVMVVDLQVNKNDDFDLKTMSIKKQY